MRLGGVTLALAVLLLLAGSPMAQAERADPGSTKNFTIESGGSVFPYIVYTPSTYRRSEPAPLVVVTHGCQTTAEEQMLSLIHI